MPPRFTRGQASAEYVGVVLVVAAILVTLAAGALAAPGLPGAVVGRLELALCVVGMDVCDAAQARASGLEPCVTASGARTEDTSLLVAVVDAGGGDALRVERRSDGHYLVTAGYDQRAGVSTGIGPFTVAAGGGFGSGLSWEAHSLAEVRAVLGDTVRDPHDAAVWLRVLRKALPAERVTTFRQLDGAARAGASVEVGGRDKALGVADGSAELRGAVGRSVHAGVATYYYDVAATKDGPLADVLPAVEGTQLRGAWQRSDPPVLTVTAASPVRDGRTTQTVARMVLSEPADRAAARRWLLDPRAIADATGRGLAARMRTAATVQRFTYAEEAADEGSFALSGRLGVGLGVEHEARFVTRRLVDARVLGLPAGGRRLDCLPG